MEIYQIVLIVIAVIAGACGAFYTFLKVQEKKGEARRQIKVSRIPELTLEYIKDWVKVEIGNSGQKSAGIMLADRAKFMEESMIPDELKKDREHLLVLAAREKEQIYKIRLIHFETMDDRLARMLEESDGVFNIRN
ncbi:MAG TPA: hypothetical protein IAB31_07140 [Candidatus Choladousia intestinavium]|uniref:Uncharacterized protein n=1 Tax=Candidatus Choladousia intestinavium TaxID=2840727 RepID=A0A9D1D8V9_9FIRM|nr:hypothetical protein [Candidatus Choladousia intestinavium]